MQKGEISVAYKKWVSTYCMFDFADAKESVKCPCNFIKISEKEVNIDSCV